MCGSGPQLLPKGQAAVDSKQQGWPVELSVDAILGSLGLAEN